MTVVHRFFALVMVLCCVSGCSLLGGSDSGIEVEARQNLEGRVPTYLEIAELGIKKGQEPDVRDVCFIVTRGLFCVDEQGRRTADVDHFPSYEREHFWESKTALFGYAVYQPKDGGRVFFTHRTSDGVMFWVVYDPQGRDLPGWLRAQGFTDVGSYNDNFAWAGRIVDQQKRHDFWIWVQARQKRIAEFEAKFPTLAATELPEESRGG